MSRSVVFHADLNGRSALGIHTGSFESKAASRRDRVDCVGDQVRDQLPQLTGSALTLRTVPAAFCSRILLPCSLLSKNLRTTSTNSEISTVSRVPDSR